MQPLKETVVGYNVWLTAEEIKPKKCSNCPIKT